MYKDSLYLSLDLHNKQVSSTYPQENNVLIINNGHSNSISFMSDVPSTCPPTLCSCEGSSTVTPSISLTWTLTSMTLSHVHTYPSHSQMKWWLSTLWPTNYRRHVTLSMFTIIFSVINWSINNRTNHLIISVITLSFDNQCHDCTMWQGLQNVYSQIKQTWSVTWVSTGKSLWSQVGTSNPFSDYIRF